jgi:hypothetical protein
MHQRLSCWCKETLSYAFALSDLSRPNDHRRDGEHKNAIPGSCNPPTLAVRCLSDHLGRVKHIGAENSDSSLFEGVLAS